ncbi:hypothetical protein MRX96_025550 [Rhipicephalus microplus]
MPRWSPAKFPFSHHREGLIIHTRSARRLPQSLMAGASDSPAPTAVTDAHGPIPIRDNVKTRFLAKAIAKDVSLC